MAYYKRASDGVLNYRDNRDRAHVEVKNIVRHVLNEVDNVISLELARAELDGRELELDLSPDGIKHLILKSAISQLGGAESVAIDSTSEDKA